VTLRGFAGFAVAAAVSGWLFGYWQGSFAAGCWMALVTFFAIIMAE
jgi:hypothetical protein